MNRVVTGALREVPPLVTVALRAVMEAPQVVVQEAHHPLEDLGTLVGGMDTLDTGARAHVLPSDTGAGTRATAAPGTPLENHKATPLQTEAAIPHNRVDKGTVILPEGVTTEQGGPRPFLENTKAPQPQLGHPQYQIG